MVAGNHTFLGIGQVEAQDRISEYRTGVPSHGNPLTTLLHAPIGRLSGVKVVNSGDIACEARLRHQGATKTATTESIQAFDAGGNRFVGRLAHDSVTPGSVVVQEAGALADIVDDGAGVLHDIGIPANTRGTVDYDTGLIALTWGAGATAPVPAPYTHAADTAFVRPQQASSAAAAALPFTLQLGFGRVVPGSVAITDGNPLTFIDDGKGNIIETTGGGAVVAGTIDYGTGVVTLTATTAPLAGTVAATFNFNPFATLLVGGAAAKLLDTHGSPIPELTAQPFAAGIKGESRIGLVGSCTVSGAQGTDLITQWVHYGEEPFRVEIAYSGFPPGGASATGAANA